MIKLNIISNINKYNYLIDEFGSKILDKFEKVEIEKIFGLKNDIELNMYIDTKKGLDAFVQLNSQSYKDTVPLWLLGFSNEKCVYVAVKEDNINESITVSIHELIHLLSYHLNINGKRIRLLEEGLAYYYANQMTTGRFNILKEDFKLGKIKKFKDLVQMNSIEFANNNGYYYGFFLIKFLNNTYNKQRAIFYIQNSNDFLKNLNKLQIEFETYMNSEFKKYN